jgi:hypothetical protein
MSSETPDELHLPRWLLIPILLLFIARYIRNYFFAQRNHEARTDRAIQKISIPSVVVSFDGEDESDDDGFSYQLVRGEEVVLSEGWEDS